MSREAEKGEVSSEKGNSIHEEEELGFGYPDEIVAEKMSKQSIGDIASGIQFLIVKMQTMEKKQEMFEESLLVSKALSAEKDSW